MSARVLPRDERDAFCTCPSCELLGNHLVRVTVFKARWMEGADGDQVMIPAMSDPPDGTRRAERTCVFCGYVWHTEAAQEGL